MADVRWKKCYDGRGKREEITEVRLKREEGRWKSSLRITKSPFLYSSRHLYRLPLDSISYT